MSLILEQVAILLAVMTVIFCEYYKTKNQKFAKRYECVQSRFCGIGEGIASFINNKCLKFFQK